MMITHTDYRIDTENEVFICLKCGFIVKFNDMIECLKLHKKFDITVVE
ncbi:MAG: hypothetical protein ACE5K4_10985 [Candidatus Hydrothermarchaeota archaeon]